LSLSRGTSITRSLGLAHDGKRGPARPSAGPVTFKQRRYGMNREQILSDLVNFSAHASAGVAIRRRAKALGSRHLGHLFASTMR
jgi:hypothetical protein